MRLLACLTQNRGSAAHAFELRRDVFADLERGHANVRPNRNEQLGARMTQRAKCVGYDASNGAAPTGMHRRNVTAPRMRNQHRHAVSGAGRHRNAVVAGNERIAFLVGNDTGIARTGDRVDPDPVNLALFEQSPGRDAERISETCAVLPYRLVAIAEMKPEVQRVERGFAHSTLPGPEHVAELVLV